MPKFELERVIQSCKESGFPLTARVWMAFGRPNSDILLAVHPLVVEPLLDFGGPRLREEWNQRSMMDILQDYYELNSPDVLALWEGFSSIPSYEAWINHHYYELGSRLYNRLRLMRLLK